MEISPRLTVFGFINKCYFNNENEFWLKVLHSEAGQHASWSVGWLVGQLGVGGIGNKTNSAPNCCWVGVGAELGKK